MHRFRVLFAATSTLAALAAAVALPTGAAAQQAGQIDVVVHRGESIQAALDSVPAGATVTVRPGTYAENLVIDRSVTLRGVGGVRLLPPDAIVDNVCTLDPDAQSAGMTETGICVIGAVDATANPPIVKNLLDGVRISGLTVAGFHGIAVEAYATRGLHVDHVTAEHNAGGGFWAAWSPGVRLEAVVARDNDARGINLQWDDDDARVSSSTSTGNRGEGVFVGDSTGVTVTRNQVADNCAGIVVADIWSPTDVGVARATVTRNQVMANNRFCPGDPETGEPSESGTGIALASAADSVVADNRVLRNAAGQRAQLALGGIAVLDGPTPGAPLATGNTITSNVVLGNQPADLLDLSAGTGNAFMDNVCATSADEATAPCTR